NTKAPAAPSIFTGFHLVHPEEPAPKTDLKSLATEENILADPIIQQKLLHSNEKLAQEGQVRHFKTAAAITKGVSPTVGSREIDIDEGLPAGKIQEGAKPRNARSAERTQASFALPAKAAKRRKASHNELPDRKINDMGAKDMWLPMAKTQVISSRSNERPGSVSLWSAESAANDIPNKWEVR
ncbi:hypothetical protein OSTOST_11296, partial [Ostertagia ostertagi]